MYKKASRLKLRFATKKGSLSVEQLWDLGREDLKAVIKEQHEILSEGGDGLSFLGEDKADPIEELKFDILKDIWKTLEKEDAEKREMAEKRVRNKRIQEIIARKQEAELEEMSVEDLLKMLEE